TSSGTITVSYDTGYQGYTSAEASKLSSIEAGATVGADWSVNLSNIPANIASWASIAPGAKVNTAGDTMTGHLIIGNAFDLRLDSPTPDTRLIRWMTAGSNRWAAFANGTAESGANAGSDFVLRRYSDSGSFLSPDPIAISRASGLVSFGVRPLFAGNVPWDAGNLVVTTGTATWNPPSIPMNGSASTTVSIPGAVMGDIVMASFTNDLQGMTISAYISAAGTATVVLTNNTAAAINLASGTVKAMVIR